MADLRISELPVLAAGDLEANDPVALADLSASETRQLTAKGLIQSGVNLIDDGSLPGAKIADDSITALQIAPDAITASELADDAVDTAAIQDLAVTDAKIAAGVDGKKIAGNTLPALAVDPAALDRGIDKVSGRIGHTNAIVPGLNNGISYDAQGHVTAVSFLLPSDLPIATDALIGAASYPAVSGLQVSAAGVVTHIDSIAPGTISGLTLNGSGHVTNAVPLIGDDLPVATDVSLGGVAVPVGDALGVTGTGDLFHLDSGVVVGIYPKVEVDANGHVIQGLALDPGDIPDLDASKITTGEFDGSALLADKSVTKEKLADYAISYIQEAEPTSFDPGHIGCLWYQESTAQLRMWNGNSWMPVGFGRLSEDNLRFAGTIDASTGLVTAVTEFGVQGGFAVGDALPVATDALGGVYFVVDSPGSAINAFDVIGANFDAGDWVLAVSAVTGWIRIDTLGGGGGGATVLGDLLDVTLASLNQDDIFTYNAALARWENSTELVGGTY